jgi:hypothetical protein
VSTQIWIKHGIIFKPKLCANKITHAVSANNMHPILLSLTPRISVHVAKNPWSHACEVLLSDTPHSTKTALQNRLHRRRQEFFLIKLTFVLSTLLGIFMKPPVCPPFTNAANRNKGGFFCSLVPVSVPKLWGALLARISGIFGIMGSVFLGSLVPAFRPFSAIPAVPLLCNGVH